MSAGQCVCAHFCSTLQTHWQYLAIQATYGSYGLVKCCTWVMVLKIHILQSRRVAVQVAGCRVAVQGKAGQSRVQGAGCRVRHTNGLVTCCSLIGAGCLVTPNANALYSTIATTVTPKPNKQTNTYKVTPNAIALHSTV